MMAPEDRYRHDPVFRRLVDILELQIREAQYTPSELREAAILAAIHYESTTVRPIFLDPNDPYGPAIQPRDERR